MFDALKPQSQDKIIELIKLLRDDPRPVKVDLGVGVYKDATGHTPIMRAVKAAEKQLWNDETTKTYVALLGDPGFHDVMVDLILGDAVPRENVAAVATPGGTGAVHHGLELIRMSNPDATVWVSDPTWPNHLSIMNYLEIPFQKYRYFDEETCAVDFPAMMTDLENVAAGDVVLLHGCCHNPTGANLNLGQLAEVAELIRKKGATPFVDIAYQGFGDALDTDAIATRHLAHHLPEVLIAASCSKNFGLYRERTGILLGVCPDADAAGLVSQNMSFLNRQNFSFPPDHGARLVTMILSDPELKADWQAELEEVRTSMLSLRQKLSEALRDRLKSDRFGFIAQHRGMFSRLGLTEAQVQKLREDHAIYMVSDSRINIAGLNEDNISILADAIAKVVD